MRRKLRDSMDEAVDLMQESREVIVPSGAGDRVLGRRGHTWYLRKLRRGDKVKLPATEGVGAGELGPA